jgi:hypothetical protein
LIAKEEYHGGNHGHGLFDCPLKNWIRHELNFEEEIRDEP